VFEAEATTSARAGSLRRDGGTAAGASICAVSESTEETGQRGRRADPAPAGALAGWARPGRLAVIAVAVAVVALVAALWALLDKPATPAPAAATSQQIADAKGRACNAFTEVRGAVASQTHNDLGSDPTAQLAVAANARLAMYGGGTYLLGRLDPATPAPLADAIHSFANDLQDISIAALDGVDPNDPAQMARLHDGQTVSTQIADLCK
jgi:hypothetical protein